MEAVRSGPTPSDQLKKDEEAWRAEFKAKCDDLLAFGRRYLRGGK